MDCEGMYSNPLKAAVVDFSVFVFSWNRFLKDPYTFEELLDTSRKFKLDIAYQVKTHGFEIEKDCLENFWLKMPTEDRAAIKPLPTDYKTLEFTNEFMGYLDKQPRVSHWWTRNNTYNHTMLWRLFWSEDRKYEINEY